MDKGENSDLLTVQSRFNPVFTICTVIFAASFCVRLVYLFYYRGSVFFDGYVVDALFHYQWAQDILSGDVFSLNQGDVFYKPPLYPYFMAFVYGLFNNGLFALRLIQITLGSFNCVLIYLISRKHFSHVSSVIASLIYSFYFVAIYFDAEIEVPVIAIFLTLSSFYLLYSVKSRLVPVLSSVLLGLSVLALPTNLLLVPLYLWMVKKSGTMSRVILYFVIILLVISQCTLRNIISSRHFVLVSANGGINFYIGNNEHYDETVAVQPGVVWDRFSSQPRVLEGITSNYGEDKYWYRESFKYINENPLHFAGSLLKKSVLYFTNYEMMRNRDIYFAWDQSFLSKLPFPFPSLLLIFPLGVTGLLISFKRYKDRLGLYLFLLLLILPCIIFFVTSRYRLPSVTIWSIFAGFCVTEVVKYLRDKRWKSVICCSAGIIVIGFIVKKDFFVIKNPPSRPYYNLGCVYSDKKDYPKAIKSYQKCLDLMEPGHRFGYMVEAEVNMRIGDIFNVIYETDSALLYLDKAISLFNDYDRAYYKRGLIYFDACEHQKAFRDFLEAVKNNSDRKNYYKYLLKTLNRILPSQADAENIIKSYQAPGIRVVFYNYLGAQEIKKQDFEKARKYFQKAYQIDSNDTITKVNLGFLALQNNDRKAAERYKIDRLTVVRKYDYYFQTGLAEGKAGYLRSALEYMLQAVRFRQTTHVYYNLGLIKVRLEDYKGAVPYLQKALEIDPRKENARSLLDYVLTQEI